MTGKENLEIPPKGQEEEAPKVKKAEEEAPPLSDEDKELKEYADSKKWKFTEDTKPMLKSMREEEKHLREVEEGRATAVAEGKIYKERADELSKPPEPAKAETFKEMSERINEKFVETGNLAEAIVEVTGRAFGPIAESNMKQQEELSLRLYKLSDQYKDAFKMKGFEADVRKLLDNIPEHLRGRIQNVEDCIELAKGKRLDEIIDLKAKDKAEAEKTRKGLVGNPPNFASPGASLLKKEDELTKEEEWIIKNSPGLTKEKYLAARKRLQGSEDVGVTERRGR